MSRPLQAVIFDFDGVIANSEPLHLMAYQQLLAEEAIELTSSEYYAKYLGYDDRGVFEALSHDRGLQWGDADVDALIERKGTRMHDILRSGSVLFPGAVQFIREAAAAVPIAIASGAQHDEILASTLAANAMSNVAELGNRRSGGFTFGPTGLGIPVYEPKLIVLMVVGLGGLALRPRRSGSATE